MSIYTCTHHPVPFLSLRPMRENGRDSRDHCQRQGMQKMDFLGRKIYSTGDLQLQIENHQFLLSLYVCIRETATKAQTELLKVRPRMVHQSTAWILFLFLCLGTSCPIFIVPGPASHRTSGCSARWRWDILSNSIPGLPSAIPSPSFLKDPFYERLLFQEL